MNKPPLLQNLAFDPILAKVKLIAEAWEAGGLYQVGSFPSWNRWSEWNGKYHDDIRKFLKGDAGLAVVEWRIAVNTAMSEGQEFIESVDEMLRIGTQVELEPRSVVIILGIQMKN